VVVPEAHSVSAGLRECAKDDSRAAL